MARILIAVCAGMRNCSKLVPPEVYKKQIVAAYCPLPTIRLTASTGWHAVCLDSDGSPWQLPCWKSVCREAEIESSELGVVHAYAR